MTLSTKQQTQQLLEQLPPEGIAELRSFIEFLQFKYRLAPPVEPLPPSTLVAEVPADSLTARYRGFVQSRLSVAELGAAYETMLLGDEEE